MPPRSWLSADSSRRLRWAFAASAIAAGLLATGTAQAVRVGYNEDPGRLLEIPRAVEHSNTQIARVSFTWATIEPVDDEFDWKQMDEVIALLHENEIRPIITIFGSPKWAGPSNPGIQCSCDRAADPEWQQMWQRVALRYPGAALSVWNEPNLAPFGDVSVERMAELTNEAADAIWAVAPWTRVIGPPAAPVKDWLSYAAALYPRLDPKIGMAANIYPYGRLIPNLRKDLAAVRKIAHGRRIWITETNASRVRVGRRGQHRYVDTVFELAKRHAIRAVIFHRLWSPFRERDGIFGWDAGQSALRLDGAPRALYEQIGRLKPGFRPLHAVPGTTGNGIVVGPPPPVVIYAPPIEACPG